MNEQESQGYWHGKENRAVRYWVYAQKGIGVINEFKYYGAFIIWLYYALRFPSIWWIPLVGVASFPILIIVGRYYLHRVAKTSEFVNRHYGTVLGYDDFTIHLNNNEVLKQIAHEMRLLREKKQE